MGVPEPGAAKLYGAGQYVTTVPANAPAWYSFKIGAGQSIAISATLPNSDAGHPVDLQDRAAGREPRVHGQRRRDQLATTS